MTICYIFVISICLALCLVANISEDESKPMIIDITNQDSANTEKTDKNAEAISDEEVDELIKKIIG